MSNIVLCGGHAATTALATLQSLRRNKKTKNSGIHWIGASTAIEGQNVLGIEAESFPKFGVVLHFITAGRLQRKFTKNTIPSLLKVPIGFWQSLMLLNRLRPKIVVSFGGFVGFPVVVAAKILGIPSVLHEQTVAAGLANRLSSYFVKTITLARKESITFFPKNKIEIIGNPIIDQIAKVSPKKKPSSPPTIFITCGSRGAQTVNAVVEKLLPKLLKKYVVIHQTGEIDALHFKKIRNLNYFPYSTIPPLSVSLMYSRADIIIARSGANTVAEIYATRRPAILIPIPWVQQDEQNKNAIKLGDTGLAQIISEKDLSPEVLYKNISQISANYTQIISNLVPSEDFEKDLSAARTLASIISRFV